jgi:hypothetical protein
MTRILLCFLLLIAGARGLVGADSSEQFLNAYQAYQDGEKLERNGNVQDALKKYRFAESLLNVIETNDPSWQKAVVEYRLKKVRDGLGRLEAGGVTNQTSLDSQVDQGSASPPIEGSVGSSSPSISIIPPGSNQSTNSNAASAEVKRLKKMIESLRLQLQEATSAVTSNKNRAKDLESIKWVEERSKLEKELQIAKNQVADLNEKLQQRDSWESDLKSLQKKLDDVVADKAAMEEDYKNRDRKKDESNAQLLQQLEEVRVKLAAGATFEKQCEKLSGELEASKKEMASMKEQLDRTVQAAKENEALNISLKKEFSETTEKLRIATRQANELAPLREKYQQLQQTAAKADTDSQTSQQRIVKLEKEASALKDLSSKKESGLRADLQALEEERNTIALKLTKLADAARDASKVRGLESESAALKKTIVELQEKQVLADQEIAKSRKVGESSSKEAEESQAKLSALAASVSADRAVLEEERLRIAAKLEEATRQNDVLRKVAETSAPLSNQLNELKQRLEKTSRSLNETNIKLAETEKAAAKHLAEAETAGKNFAAANVAASKNALSLEADKAALEEERQHLLAMLAEASKKNAELRSEADSTGPLTTQIDELKSRLAENSKASDQAKSNYEKALQSANDHLSEARGKLDASIALKQVIEKQNASLQEQLKGAMGQMSSIVDHGEDSEGLRSQIKKLQQQMDANAAEYAQSQARIAELLKAAPEQNKLIQQREQEVSLAKQDAEKLRAELAKSNQTIADLQHHSDEGDDRLKKLQIQLADLTKATPLKDQELAHARDESAKLRSEITETKSKLAALEKKGVSSNDQLKDLKESLAEKDAQLARYSKRKGKPSGGDKLSDENDLLRGIVLRQVKEEARRSQARRLFEDEMKRLNVQSQTLSEQISILSSPATELTPQERSLFKTGQIIVADAGNGKIEASVSAPIAKGGSGSGVTSVQETNTPGQESPEGRTKTSPATSVVRTNGDSQDIPWEGKLKECLAKAKDEFDRQDYLQAENTFQEALKISPDDYFALSNIGVVEFQLGKMTDAETFLKRAASKSKESSFALTTLGIVHYRQQRLDEAQKVLRKAVEINAQDFTAHNYLGIVLAASGNGKAGEGEIMRAIEINPQYADAHFNLAVIYATGKPPSKMMAKKHYAKAIELGAPPDPSLERLVQ